MAIKVSGTVVIDDSRVVSNLGAALTVSNGGHGQTTLTANSLVVGNGTGAVTLLAPGSSSNIVVSDGTNFVSSNTANIRIGSIGVGTSASGTLGEIRAIDNITAYYSDGRLKEIKGPIKNALQKVMSLNGVEFTQNKFAEQFGYHDYRQQVGVIAQEIEQVLPEVVKVAPFDMDLDGNSKSGNKYLTVQYEKIVPLLIEAIKELSNQMRDLEQKQEKKNDRI